MEIRGFPAPLSSVIEDEGKVDRNNDGNDDDAKSYEKCNKQKDKINKIICRIRFPVVLNRIYQYI